MIMFRPLLWVAFWLVLLGGGLPSHAQKHPYDLQVMQNGERRMVQDFKREHVFDFTETKDSIGAYVRIAKWSTNYTAFSVSGASLAYSSLTRKTNLYYGIQLPVTSDHQILVTEQLQSSGSTWPDGSPKYRWPAIRVSDPIPLCVNRAWTPVNPLHKETIGMDVPLNINDSDEDNIPDDEDIYIEGDDPDLVAVRIRHPQGLPIQLAWSNDIIHLYERASKKYGYTATSRNARVGANIATNPYKGFDDEIVYVEGIAPGSTFLTVTGPGNIEDRIKINVTLNVEFEKASTEDATGNKYGYDTLDTPASSDDDQISVMKNDSTYVTVKVAGGVDGSVLHFTSSDSSTAEPGAVPSPAPGTGFLLEVKGKDQDSSETTLQARLGSATGPICAEINVNVYKEKTINEWDIYRVTDSNSGGTSPLTAISEATTLASANAIVKKGVMRFASVNVEDKDIQYDVNSNGALEWYYDGGAQTEYGVIQSAGLTGNPKIVVVKNVNFAWRLSADASAGQPKANVVGASYLSSWTGMTYTLGIGANSENVTLLSVSGTELTFSGNLVNAHVAGESLVAAFGAGVGADPQIVEDGTAIQTTLLHETLHRTDVGSLLDVNSLLNIMHYEAGVGHTELRFKELPTYYGSGNENQWETIPRP